MLVKSTNGSLVSAINVNIASFELLLLICLCRIEPLVCVCVYVYVWLHFRNVILLLWWILIGFGALLVMSRALWSGFWTMNPSAFSLADCIFYFFFLILLCHQGSFVSFSWEQISSFCYSGFGPVLCFGLALSVHVFLVLESGLNCSLSPALHVCYVTALK